MHGVVSSTSICWGPIEMTKAFLPHVGAGAQKKFVVITSGMGSIARTRGELIAYRASKSALNMAMRSYAMELRESHIIVGLLTPGLVRTEMTAGQAAAATSVASGVSMIEPEESARALADRINELTLEVSGEFRRHDGGNAALVAAHDGCRSRYAKCGRKLWRFYNYLRVSSRKECRNTLVPKSVFDSTFALVRNMAWS